MSNRFRPAWLLVLAALSASALAKAPETVNIGYQKANIFALLKYRGTLDESLKKQGIAVRWVEFPAGPQMLEGLNVGSIDLAATGDAPPAFAQAAQADLVYLAHSPLTQNGSDCGAGTVGDPQRGRPEGQARGAEQGV
jgi:sulfonate transport system substrate-binding protein